MLRNWLWNTGSYPFSNKFMYFLSHFRWRSFPSAYGPYRLISNNNLGPILDTWLNSIKMSLDHILSGACFSLLKFFPNTEYRIDPVFLASVNFLGYDFISLFEMCPSLAVSHYSPLQSKVFNLFCGHLASDWSCRLLSYILCTHLYMWM